MINDQQSPWYWSCFEALHRRRNLGQGLHHSYCCFHSKPNCTNTLQPMVFSNNLVFSNKVCCISGSILDCSWAGSVKVASCFIHDPHGQLCIGTSDDSIAQASDLIGLDQNNPGIPQPTKIHVKAKSTCNERARRCHWKVLLPSLLFSCGAIVIGRVTHFNKTVWCK